MNSRRILLAPSPQVTRVCSFVPAVTEIILQLGCEAQLLGVTDECRASRPHVARSKLLVSDSQGIDLQVRESAQTGTPLFEIDRELLASIKPEIIFVQDVCSVCQVDSPALVSALSSLEYQPKIISLAPRRLRDIFENVRTIGEALGVGSRATEMIASLENRLKNIQQRREAANSPVRPTVLIEWISPLFSSGHWIPDQIAFAGGVDPFARAGAKSQELDFQELRRLDPEHIIFSPCGLSLETAEAELRPLLAQPSWQSLRAVKHRAVSIIEPQLITEPSSNVVTGVEVLASILHPEVFPRTAEHASLWKKM